MASRISAAWRIGAGTSTTTTGRLNFNHVTKSTPALARWTPVGAGIRSGSALISTSSASSSASTSLGSTTTSTPAVTTAFTPAAWPPRLRLGSSGTAPLARTLFQRQQHQHQQRRSFGGFNFLSFLMCHPPICPPCFRCISSRSSIFRALASPLGPSRQQWLWVGFSAWKRGKKLLVWEIRSWLLFGLRCGPVDPGPLPRRGPQPRTPDYHGLALAWHRKVDSQC